MENEYIEALERALKSIKTRVERANFKTLDGGCLAHLILEDVAKAQAAKPLPYDEREHAPDMTQPNVVLPVGHVARSV